MTGSNNNFPGVGYINRGVDRNFYQALTITNTTFGGDSIDGYQPSTICTTPNHNFILTNESSGQIVEYSFNGNTIHGILDGTATSTTRSLTFLNRSVSLIWFRIKTGSSSANITITAW